MIDLDKILDSATMNRTPFELRHFVVNRHVHPMRQYRQIVAELTQATHAIRSCEIGKRKRALKREKLVDRHDRALPSDRPEFACDIEQLDLDEQMEARALAGKLKEVAVLTKILEEEFGDWIKLTEEEQLKCEPEYWIGRLARQASNELISTGSISVGMIEAIRQLDPSDAKKVLEAASLECSSFGPLLDASRTSAEKRLLEQKEKDGLLA